MVTANTSWPEAFPEVTDLPHASDCDECIEAGDSLIDIECNSCGYTGDAPAVDYQHSKVIVHCPECGADHSFAREHDRDD